MNLRKKLNNTVLDGGSLIIIKLIKKKEKNLLI